MNSLLAPLRADQLTLLEVVSDPYLRHERWPTFEYVAGELRKQQLDARVLLRSLPRAAAPHGVHARGYGLVSSELQYQPDSKIWLTVAGHMHVPALAPRGQSFVGAVQKLRGVLMAQPPSPFETVSVEVRSQELVSGPIGSFSPPFIRSLPQLLTHEPISFYSNLSGSEDGTGWSMTLGQALLEFDDITTVADYVERVIEITGGRQLPTEVFGGAALSISPAPAPQPERLRVAYLTANPRVTDVDPQSQTVVETRIRVDNEVRSVREEVRRAHYRDAIEIDHWPAATPTDILNVLNDQRPHVIHFSGHGGQGLLEFDDGEVRHPIGQLVTLEQLAAALAATAHPPKLVVLNACDALTGAEILLGSVSVVIATTRSITDLAATLFATKFYAAIAAGQPVRHALGQAKFAIDVLAGGNGDVIQSLACDGVDLADLVLVEASAKAGWTRRPSELGDS